MGRKGQALPLNTLVLGALALLVLLVLSYIFMGGTAGWGATLAKQMQTYIQNCQSYCEQLRNWASTSGGYLSLSDVQSSAFCTAVYDTSKYKGTVADHCYDDGAASGEIKVKCTVAIMAPAKVCPSGYTWSSTDGKCVQGNNKVDPIETTYYCSCDANADWKIICTSAQYAYDVTGGSTTLQQNAGCTCSPS